MSEFIDFDHAVYPFPPKLAPLNTDQKAFYRERITIIGRKKCGDCRALLYRS